MSALQSLRLASILGVLAASHVASAQTGTPAPTNPSSGSFAPTTAEAPPAPAPSSTASAPAAPPPAAPAPAPESTATPVTSPPAAPAAAPAAPKRELEPLVTKADEPEPYSRRGFFFVFGIGCSVASLLCTSDSGNGYYPAFATKFQIGAAVSDTTMVHWTSRVEWKTDANVNFDDGGQANYNTEVHPWGVGGVGVTHFFSETPTSLYIGGDVGFSNMMDLDDGENDLGFGACEELGWEFVPHFSVEHALCLGTADDGRDHPASSPFLASLTLNYLTK